jgi:glycine cleavage system H protein
MANVPAELRYTPDHEWAKKEGERIRVGITAFAQAELGDVVFVELPKVGAKMTKRQSFGVVESVKALAKAPETVNQDPYGQGWMIVIKPSSAAEWDELLTSVQYEELIAQGGH